MAGGRLGSKGLGIDGAWREVIWREEVVWSAAGGKLVFGEEWGWAIASAGRHRRTLLNSCDLARLCFLAGRGDTGVRPGWEEDQRRNSARESGRIRLGRRTPTDTADVSALLCARRGSGSHLTG